MNFLPAGFEKLKNTKSYWKMSEMKEGDNRLRIVSRPIAGWLDWEDNKPRRYTPDNKPAKPYDPEKPVKAFWACHVWDYAREALFVIEITQSSILKGLTNLGADADWGDFTQYDIKINKTGSGKDTRYGLMPVKPGPLSQDIQDAIKASPVRLSALFDGLDPWTDLEAPEASYEVYPEAKDLRAAFASPQEELREKLEAQGLDSGYLDTYLQQLGSMKNKTVAEMAKAYVGASVFDRFRVAYEKFLANFDQVKPLAQSA
jgi:hypothetical protein